MQVELTEHLGYEKHDAAGINSGNSRNGTFEKTLKGDFGDLPVAVLHDRNSEFAPNLLAFSRKVLSRPPASTLQESHSKVPAGLRDLVAVDKRALPRLLLRYTQMLLAMTGQSSACNKLHSLEQQLARWLLLMHDYVRDDLVLTQELISLTLGVRRAGITQAANDLRRAGVIDYQRGHIQVLDRRGVEAKACECYRVIRDEYDRLCPDLPRLAG